jgi:hypothetical protein
MEIPTNRDSRGAELPFELLDAIAAKYPEGRFDCIFADPPAWP